MRVLRLPRLGQTMEAGTVVAWLVEPGATFEQGDVVYEVETEKVETEVAAPTAGRLVRVLVEPDREVPVGTPLAVVADPGDAVNDAAVDAFVATLADDPVASLGDGDDPAAPVADDPAASLGDDPAAPVADDLPAPGGVEERVRAMPAARRLAQELGVDLAGIDGSGPRGSITIDDVRQAAAAAPAPADASSRTDRAPASAGDVSGQGPAGPGEALTGAARRMADHLARAWQQIPHFHEIVEVDVSSLVGDRSDGDQRITINDRLVAAVAAAAREVPELNATFEDGRLLRHDDVNVAVAIATDRGLITPVVRRTDDLDLPTLSARLRDIVARAREGRLAVDELSGGTITVSNLGMFGVDTGTPVINHPQVALLFAGAVRERAVVVDGQVVARPTMFLTLACDHRVVDGAMAARFLAVVTAHLRAAAHERVR
jgi:pyruvate dehydrogenase E2 component (dihydrolipoamide acetyltransferase)